jgi:hypothetical protein
MHEVMAVVRNAAEGLASEEANYSRPCGVVSNSVVSAEGLS